MYCPFVLIELVKLFFFKIMPEGTWRSDRIISIVGNAIVQTDFGFSFDAVFTIDMALYFRGLDEGGWRGILL